MLVILSIMTFWCLTPAQPMSYPVVGAKQYQHQVPYYNQYYEQQPQQQVYVPPAAYQQHGYINENGYYYYPRHEYHTYGLPTYRGEYKPSPYYYAPGPSYSYYDDRDIAPNPLDDLHEEMLQEDERERQREMIPVIGQESWYENNRRQDDLTNNFLRNLIAYNRQIDAQQQQPPMQLTKDEPSEYDEYSDLAAPEYEYDPQPDSPYNYQKYDKQFPQQDKYDDEIEDEDERQLKSLAHSHQKSMNNKEQKHDDGGYQDTYNTNNNNNNWQQSASSFAQYDVDPEYDDSWINWDRKRSNLDTGYQSDESIKAFSNRKPTPVVQYFEKTMSTKKPSSVAATKSSTSSSASSSTTTTTTTTTTTSQPIKGAKVSGQKEVVLPRPASPVQQIFAAPVLEMIGNSLPKESDDDKRSEEGGDKSANIYETIKQLLAMEQQLERNTGSKIQKRFVSSEESLVSELDSLKRHAAA